MPNRLCQILILFGVLALLTVPSLSAQDQPGFTPRWKVGDRWMLEATYRDMNQPGEVWLPPIRWMFRVRSVKEVAGHECYVIHAHPQKRTLKMQAILFLSTKDLRPVRVIDIFPTPDGKVTHADRDIDPNNPAPLTSEGTLVPYDLPVFPLAREDVQAADGFGGYRGALGKIFPKFRRIGGLSFKKNVTQTNKKPERQHADVFSGYQTGGPSFQVELAEPRSGTLTQFWQAGSPWAVQSESPLRKVKLIPAKNPTPLPQAPQGGDDE
jgi:hypothetical protein